MSEEMNLYKRCKNIFKAHGVDMGGGVTDPILENAKETGGIGYTEGEATTIEWNGDTSGLVSVSFEGVNLYKVSDLIVPNSDIVGMSFALSNDPAVSTITQPAYEQLVEMGMISDDISAIGEGMAVFIRQNGASLLDVTFPETGVYFLKGEEVYISSLTYGNETIHEIDTKYLDIDSLKTALGLS